MTANELDVKYPLAGENRNGAYVQQREPYTTPYAVNVRSFGPHEKRGRGGVRPGLVKYISTDFGTRISGMSRLSYIDDTGTHHVDLIVIVDGAMKIMQGSTVTQSTAYLLTEDGDHILTEAGDYIYFENTIATVNTLVDSGAYTIKEHSGKLYIADSTCRRFNPRNGTVEVVANAPTSQPIVEVYRERLILSGENHIVYFSEQGDFEGWDLNDIGKHVKRANAIAVGANGLIADTITCVKSWRDKVLIMASKDELYYLTGNPSSGSGNFQVSSQDVGIISQNSIAITNDRLAVFLSRNGIYTWPVGSQSHPEEFSKDRVPEELLEVDTRMNTISMEYDEKENGVYLFITPVSDLRLHYKCNDDAANKTVTDSSGNGFTGESVNNTSTMSAVGKINDGFDMNGTSDFVVESTFYLEDFDDDLFISVWAEPDTITGYREICGINLFFGLHTEDGVVRFTCVCNDTTNSIETDSAVMEVDTMTHIIAGISLSKRKMYIYINGELVKESIINSISFATTGTGDFVFGYDPNVASALFDGILDDFRIIGSFVNADTAQELYNSGNGTEDTVAPLGQHWFLDMKTRAFWRSKYQGDHQPYCLAKLPVGGNSQVIMGCRDGYLRRHDHDASDDDGTSITSNIILGAFHLGGNKRSREGAITEIFGDIADSSGTVNWRIVTANTAEEAIDNAVDDIINGTTDNVKSSGSWTANFNNISYPRTRGAWAVIWLNSTAKWAYESLSIERTIFGRHRR